MESIAPTPTSNFKRLWKLPGWKPELFAWRKRMVCCLIHWHRLWKSVTDTSKECFFITSLHWFFIAAYHIIQHSAQVTGKCRGRSGRLYYEAFFYWGTATKNQSHVCYVGTSQTSKGVRSQIVGQHFIQKVVIFNNQNSFHNLTSLKFCFWL